MEGEARIQPYLRRLYGYAMSLVRDHDRAEDLVQECALRALGARRVPGDERAYRAWLFRILRNLHIDELRRERVQEPVGDGEELRATEYWQGQERLITVLTVRMEMAKLPAAQRELLVLVDFVGLSYREAAEVTGVPRGTVMSRLSRARRRLLEAIASSNVHELPAPRARRAR